MQTVEERIEEIEKEIRETPYHKGTQHHIGRLRARIARLKDEIVQSKAKSKHGGGEGFAQRKFGDATVVLVGLPSVGKSTLLNRLTNAQSKVAAYDFTTLEVIPGMLDYKGAKIQIFDVPGIISGAAKGRGRGKEILSVARYADLIILMTDLSNFPKIPEIEKELYDVGLRLNKTAPEVIINKKLKGGLQIISSSLDTQTITEVAKEFHLGNAEIILKGKVSLDDFIDAMVGNRVYLPSLTVLNKIDLTDQRNLPSSDDLFFISADKGIGIEKLKEGIWKKLALLRIFLKPQGKEADLINPLIIKEDDTVLKAAEKIHGDMAQTINGAYTWGKSAKFPGQRVSLSHKLEEGDIVTFLTK